MGENDILVATVVVRKASINLPDGMSNVLIIESSDVVMSHRESDEKAYMAIVMRQEQQVKHEQTYKVQNTSAESTELSNYSVSFDIYKTHNEVVACYGK